MSIFEKTKHCTKRFPCRFKLALMVFSVAVIIDHHGTVHSQPGLTCGKLTGQSMPA